MKNNEKTIKTMLLTLKHTVLGRYLELSESSTHRIVAGTCSLSIPHIKKHWRAPKPM